MIVDLDRWENLQLARDDLVPDAGFMFPPNGVFTTLHDYVDHARVDAEAVVCARDKDGNEVGVVAIRDDNIFYFVRPGRRRCGYGLEMVAAICRPEVGAWLQRERLRARIVREHHASVRLAARAGFVFAGMATFGRPPRAYLLYDRRFDQPVTPLPE